MPADRDLQHQTFCRPEAAGALGWGQGRHQEQPGAGMQGRVLEGWQALYLRLSLVWDTPGGVTLGRLLCLSWARCCVE